MALSTSLYLVYMHLIKLINIIIFSEILDHIKEIVKLLEEFKIMDVSKW